MRKLCLFLLLSSFFYMHGQMCDTINAKQTERLAKEYQKCKERIWAKKNIGITDADEIFDLATYLRQKNDTVFKSWYKMALAEYSKGTHFKNAAKKAKYLYRVALCHFYLENYAEAETWFSKAIAAKYYNSCDHYYY